MASSQGPGRRGPAGREQHRAPVRGEPRVTASGLYIEFMMLSIMVNADDAIAMIQHTVTHSFSLHGVALHLSRRIFDMSIRWLAVLPFIGILIGTAFVNQVEPLVLGMPLLLAWLVMWIVLTAVIMAIIYANDPANRSENGNSETN